MEVKEKALRNNVFIVIPAYNEASVIGNVLDELKKYGYKNIIVVDDGSSDETYSKAGEKGVVAIRHSLNRGKGAAIKTGLEAAKTFEADMVITFDGDGQHNPEDIENIIELLRKYDVVLGKRDFNERHIPYYKKVGNMLGNVVTWLIFGLHVSDSQSGLRGYSKKAINLIDTSSDRYEYDSEIMREIVRHRLSYTEQFIRVRYTEYSQTKADRQSLTSAVKTVIRMVLSR